ncbi:putative uncharacterized protein [Mycolicibacterium canariasense]|uniref:Minor tail protein n=1 Tax=Mycolicibacterium canariasense TaxID=228230 RepID=A0A117IC28_MYCCR|nr:hypothetical protein [Mycolicibacterium canariasense]MCV7213141.1 hypothetical protein [Mycolicibacterium canariasense]ORU98503.1 hypothetical protein AWB94_28590 [Mycolicibacterium canariasense]GAS98897.1 putative uncharacterized protein [Mycolicibacterium canariasense]
MSVVDPWQSIVVHTMVGGKSVQLYQFLPEHQTSLKWTRTLRETSRCDLTAPVAPELNPRELITPWLHWLSVYDSSGEDLYWTGPIVYAEGDYDTVTLTAMDVSVFAKATNVPISKRYETTDVADIAADLYGHIARQHNLPLRPIVRRDPEGDPIDFQLKQDEQDVASVIEQLAGLGLYWSVVSGVPVLGPASSRAITALGEQDFLEGGLKWVRDGQGSFNEVLVRGAEDLARANLPMGGLHLQKIVNIEDMFAVGNVQRAADQYVRQTGFIRDAITIPGGAKLHPDAPVDISHLIPSTRFEVETFGIQTRVELEGIEVNTASGDESVGVNLESVLPKTDLGKAAKSSTGGTDS